MFDVISLNGFIWFTICLQSRFDNVCSSNYDYVRMKSHSHNWWLPCAVTMQCSIQLPIIPVWYEVVLVHHISGFDSCPHRTFIVFICPLSFTDVCGRALVIIHSKFLLFSVCWDLSESQVLVLLRFIDWIIF